jgi:hypothetical protein
VVEEWLAHGAPVPVLASEGQEQQAGTCGCTMANGDAVSYAAISNAEAGILLRTGKRSKPNRSRFEIYQALCF